jgi:hypothetical protein
MANEIATDVKHLDIRNSYVVDSGTEEDIVNPWNVVSKSQTGVDYDKLISMYRKKVRLSPLYVQDD